VTVNQAFGLFGRPGIIGANQRLVAYEMPVDTNPVGRIAAKTRSTAITAGGEHGVSGAREGRSEIKALRAIWRPASPAWRRFRHDVGRGAAHKKPRHRRRGFLLLCESSGRTIRGRTIAAPGTTRSLAHLQTIEIAQRESRAPTGETLLARQNTSPKIELATTCTKAVKSGFTSL
jgi:hypothetical protein